MHLHVECGQMGIGMGALFRATEILGLEAIAPDGAEHLVSEDLDSQDLVAAIRAGFPVESADALVESGRLSAVELDRIALPRKTLANRRKNGALTADQSDRLLRVARVIAAAEENFGAFDKAHIWLRRPNAALGGACPLDWLDTEEGARAVESLLIRIGHGLAA